MNMLVYVDPDLRGSWGAHAIKGHYVSPALEHYRCYEVYIPSTRAVRTTDTLVWLPESIPMPGASSNDIIATCLTDILDALQNPSPNAPVNPLQPTQTEALKQLVKLFQTAEEKEKDPAKLPMVPEQETAPLPRVPEKMHRYPT
jgi:hypothetical protein